MKGVALDCRGKGKGHKGLFFARTGTPGRRSLQRPQPQPRVVPPQRVVPPPVPVVVISDEESTPPKPDLISLLSAHEELESDAEMEMLERSMDIVDGHSDGRCWIDTILLPHIAADSELFASCLRAISVAGQARLLRLRWERLCVSSRGS